ncbi:unnamed protein product [Miscanthus lutarioriparius]|uniref:Uncharacterized protein n=1 Tax=Miscanthus lutarioriparius TaxID=422564 RepID=A0A811QV72_9POAL|nr:unnamed protein product [Miscanthus lutarioriparius]
MKTGRWVMGVECRGLDHAGALGLIAIGNRLVVALQKLRHPHTQNGHQLPARQALRPQHLPHLRIPVKHLVLREAPSWSTGSLSIPLSLWAKEAASMRTSSARARPMRSSSRCHSLSSSRCPCARHDLPERVGPACLRYRSLVKKSLASDASAPSTVTGISTTWASFLTA